MTAPYLDDEIGADDLAQEPTARAFVHGVVPEGWDGITWPEPEVRSRLAVDAEMPPTCRGAAKLATLNGWRTRVTYARGTAPQARNRWAPGKVVSTFVLKAVRGNCTVVVVWEEGSAKTAWFVVPGDWPHQINMTRARNLLGMPRPLDG